MFPDGDIVHTSHAHEATGIDTLCLQLCYLSGVSDCDLQCTVRGNGMGCAHGLSGVGEEELP